MTAKIGFRIMQITFGIFSLLIVNSCTKDDGDKSDDGFSYGTMTDIDGNTYKTIAIGTQIWMVENLKTTHYRDGSLIANVTNGTTWYSLTTGAWCDYNNDAANGSKFGHLYNWYAVADNRNIAPDGWHVPTDSEWTVLTTYLGSMAGGKLKETGTLNWTTPNTAATNEVGFSALPGGVRSSPNGINGISDVFIGETGVWWSSTQGSTDWDAWSRALKFDNSNVNRDTDFMRSGLSIRCIKD